MNQVVVYDPTISDQQSAVRGIGRYLQILKENFKNEFEFVSNIEKFKMKNEKFIFINPFFNFLASPLTFKRITKKQIAIIHDLIPLKYPSHFPVGLRGKINITLNKLALRNYDLIITDSEASKSDIVKILKIKDQKVKVVYPCLPKVFSIQYPVFSIKKNTQYSILNTKFCLYVGDATWNKNLVNLARAIKIANINCVFVGRVFQSVFSIQYPVASMKNTQYSILNTQSKLASEEALREADSRLGRESLAEEEGRELTQLAHPWQQELKEFLELAKNDKRFIFPGFIPDSELIKLYQQATCNILPSRDEGFGFSYVEAGQFSCPSILSNIPVLKEISADNALFFDPNDPQDLAKKITEIVNDDKLKNEIGKKAKKRSLYFSQEKFRKEFTEITNNQ